MRDVFNVSQLTEFATFIAGYFEQNTLLRFISLSMQSVETKCTEQIAENPELFYPSFGCFISKMLVLCTRILKTTSARNEHFRCIIRLYNRCRLISIFYIKNTI